MRPLIAVLALLLIVPLALYLRVRNDPRVILLRPDHGAKWIKLDVPLRLDVEPQHGGTTRFRTAVHIPHNFGGATLHFRSLGSVQVILNDQVLADTGGASADWRTDHTIALSQPLSAGTFPLQLAVATLRGPNVLLAYCTELNLASDRTWEVDAGDNYWSAPATVDDIGPPAFTLRFDPTYQDVLKMLPLLLALFVGGFLIVWKVTAAPAKFGQPNNVRVSQWGSRLRWMLLIAWVFLIANNLVRLRADIGYDSLPHLQYIQYVAEHHRIPLPREGWQFFQSPLYYIVSASLYRLLQCSGISGDGMTNALRVVSMSCGAAMVQICYRASLHAFPRRPGLQAAVTAIGGLLPMNLYMSQALSNEPMAAVFTGIVVVYCFGAMKNRQVTLRTALAIGVFLGLSLLTKVTAVLIIPAVIVSLLLAMRRQSGIGTTTMMQRLGVTIGISGAISGWYYVRNGIYVGAPFVSGWDPNRIDWWQDPGYRTPGQLLEFGHALVRPVFGGIYGFWDSIYSTLWSDGFLSGEGSFEFRPQWNYTLMSCGVWLAVAMTAMLLAGLLRAVVGRRLLTAGGKASDPRASAVDHHCVVFSAAVVGCFMIAIFYLYLTLPVYSCAKASYMLGITPCIAVLIAAGLDWFSPRRILASVAGAVVFSWAIIAYFTYFSI